MSLRTLMGSGHKIVLFLLPFLVAGLVLNAARPSLFRARGPRWIVKPLATLLLLAGLTAWAWSVALILINVPRKRLATGGPYAIVKHPLYTSFALLVLPGGGLLLGSWLGVPLGAALYGGSRIFSPAEEKELAETFGAEWEDYRGRVWIPWL